MISIRNLTKIYKSGGTDLTVLNKLSLEIGDGEFMSISGRSGSGKSTLLYQIGLLDTPTSGEIYIDNIETWRLSEEERSEYRLRNLGFVFQEYALIPSLTAIENVMTPLLMQGMRIEKANEKSSIALERVGLSNRLNYLPNQLSGGQQQRVSIARAIAHEPKILFADEPTANLDSDTSKQVLDLFLNLNKQGQTIVMVTHEEEYARKTGRIVTLSDGNIISDKKVNKKKQVK